MKKRLFMVLAVLALTVCMLPMVVGAAETHEHIWAADPIPNNENNRPTCETAGYGYIPCTVDGCGAQKPGSWGTIPALGHKYTIEKVDTPATCKEAGSLHYECENGCGIPSESTPIPKLDHSYTGEKVWNKQPTCEEGGTYHIPCDYGCGAGLLTNVDPLGHKYTIEKVDTPATCDEPGEGHYECENGCGIPGSTFSIEKLGHNYSGEIQWSQRPTCEEGGTYYVPCVNGDCQAGQFTNVDPLNHKWVEVIDTHATCDKDGSGHYECENNCGKPGETFIIPASHTTENVAAKAATCTEAGNTAGVKCTKCDYTTVETIKALGHKWNDGVETKAATYTDTGIITYTCLNDASHTYEEATPVKIWVEDPNLDSVPRTGNIFVEWLYAIFA